MFCIRQYLSKKKGKKEEKIKNGSVFLLKKQETREKKAETCCNFLVKSTRYFLNLFTLGQQVLPKAYAINHSSYFATGTQKTFYKERKK